MVLVDLLAQFARIREQIGPQSMVLKNQILVQLIGKTQGAVLKLFDKKFKKKLNVSKNTVLKLAKCAKTKLPYAVLDVDQFIDLNRKISQQVGAKSALRKQELLQLIYHSVDCRYHLLLDRYYETGSFKIGLDERSVYRCLVQSYPHLASELNHAAKKFDEFWIYEAYRRCKENSFADTMSVTYRPMLASPYDPKRFSEGAYYAEKKYDGFRTLVRKIGSTLEYWSRSGQKFDTVNFLRIMDPIGKKLRSLDFDLVLDGQIWLDGEAPYDCFRLLSPLVKTKALNETYVSKYESKIRYTVFDILELNSEILVHETYVDRRARLESLNLGNLLIENQHLKTRDDLTLCFQKALDESCEGLILKHKDSAYETRRSRLWMKKKPSKDTVDVRVLDHEKGTGKYAQVYASFTVGVLHQGSLVALGKVGSGFSEAALAQINGMIASGAHNIILEITADSLTESKVYNSGYALRFPRLVRIRPDKHEPNDLGTVWQIYNGDN